MKKFNIEYKRQIFLIVVCPLAFKYNINKYNSNFQHLHINPQKYLKYRQPAINMIASNELILFCYLIRRCASYKSYGFNLNTRRLHL